MKIVHDTFLLQSYMQQFNIQQCFTSLDGIPFELRSYEKEERILEEGESMDALLYLVGGKVKISSSVQTGKALLLRFCEPFAIMGDIELIQRVAVQSQVETVQPVHCIAVSFHYIYKHLLNDPKFLLTLLSHTTYKLQTCTTASRVNLLASVENRFASYLLSTLQEADDFGKEMRTTNTQEIADLIGTTPRHLNRIIQKLTEQRIICKEQESIVIIDPKELQKRSHGIRYES